jgi:DNA-binding SARP family transcriptional activator
MRPRSPQAPIMIVLHTLGVAAIHLGARRILPSATRAFASLLFLGVERGRDVPRGDLQALLFPDQGDRTAAHNLRQLLYRLRSLGVPVVAGERSVTLPAHEVTDDYSALRAGSVGPGAVEAVAGGILPGYAPDFSRRFAEWVEAQREHIGQRLLGLLAARLAELRSAGRWRELEPVARAVLGLDPLHEEATLARAECLALTGQKARAVQLLDTYIEDVGAYSTDIRLPAHVLRTRISEHVPDPSYRRLGPGPFLGRDREMAELWRHYQRAKQGEPRTVVIHGEPGIGKTRLATEFLKAAALDGATCLKVECAPHDVRRPLGVFVDLVPKLLEAPGGLGVAPEGMEFLNRVTAARVVKPDSLALSEPISVSAAIEDAISDLLAAVASEQTLVITLDNGQFADPVSVRMLAERIAAAHGLPVMVIAGATNRLPALKSQGHRTRAFRMHLRGLSSDASEAILRGLAMEHNLRLADDATAEMVSLTVGNPLYIESLLHDYRGESVEVLRTSTLEELLQQRIDDLDDIALVILAACSVIGRKWSIATVDKLAGVNPLDLIRGLQELHDRGLLRDSGSDSDRVHPLVGRAALARIGGSAVRVLHRRMAEYLHNVESSDNNPARLLDCSTHWEQAGESSRGVALLTSYARYCTQIGQPSMTYDVLARAVAMTTQDARPDLLDEAIRTADLAERYEDVCRQYRLRQSLRGEIVPHDDLELIEINASRHTGVSLDRRADQLWHCLQSPKASPKHRLRAAAIYIVYADGWFRSAEAERTLELARPLAECDDSCRDLWLNVELLYNLHFGDPSIAIGCAQRALEIVRHNGNEWYVMTLGMNAAIAYFIGGNYSGAVDALSFVRDTAIRKGMRRAEAQAASLLSTVHLEYGLIDEARGWDAIASAAIATIGSHAGMYSHLSNRIEFALLDQDPADARRWLEYSRLTYVELASPHNASIEVGYDALIAHIEAPGCSLSPRLGQLKAHHQAARFSWSHDGLMEALVTAHLESNQPKEAEASLAQYLQEERRERTPLRPGIGRLARDLGVSHNYPDRF